VKREGLPAFFRPSAHFIDQLEESYCVDAFSAVSASNVAGNDFLR